MERVSKQQCLELIKNKSFWEIAELARNTNQKINSNQVVYQNYLNINHTNECELRCPLCAFSCDINQGYLLSEMEILEKCQIAWNSGIKEIHLVGGLHPEADFNYFIKLFEKIKKQYPEMIIQALTAVEIFYISENSGISVIETLQKLKESGLDCIPGGGAEIFSERIRKLAAPKKISGDIWLSVHKKAHQLGIPTNATILFDAGETPEEYLDHLEKLRSLQDETQGFRALVPLKYHPANTGYQPDLQTHWNIFTRYAVTRIFLDNFPHIKVLWLYLGIKTAQLLLSFGVSDFGSTGFEEKIVRSAGANPEYWPDEKRICDIIEKSGKIPVKIDTRLNKTEG